MLKKPTFFIVLACALIGIGLSLPSNARGSADRFGPKYYWTFDADYRSRGGTPIELQNFGGRLIADGLSGGAVALPAGAYMELAQKNIFAAPAGTLLFWVRPHWSDTGTEPAGSHTFLSFSWRNASNAYGVLSDGWWEDNGGQPFTYCIFNNQTRTKTEKRIVYRQGEWMQFACTWRTTPAASVRFYVNGLRVGESRKPLPRNRELARAMVIGTDGGAPGAMGRHADCDLDDFAVFDRELPAEDIMALYTDAMTARFQFADAPVKKQIRAIFDEGVGWTTEAGAVNTIRRIKLAGFNVYVPCVWHGMGSRYPTALVAAEGNRQFHTRDPLARLIAIAHAEGIEVHPWFTVALRQREFLPQFYDSGTPEQAFNLHDSSFRQFIVALMMDVVERYDIDGLNLDYIRTMGFCTSSACRQAYNATYGRDLLNDIAQQAVGGRLESSLQEWNELVVEAIVTSVATQARLLKPGLTISVDGAPRPAFETADREGRNEVNWARRGYVDVIFNMDYRKVPDLERLEFISLMLAGRGQVLPLLGNYDRDKWTGALTSRDATALERLVDRVLARNPAGFGMYVYPLLDDRQMHQLTRFGARRQE